MCPSLNIIAEGNVCLVEHLTHMTYEFVPLSVLRCGGKILEW